MVALVRPSPCTSSLSWWLWTSQSLPESACVVVGVLRKGSFVSRQSSVARR
jgi:hypothetical protein